MTVAALGIGAGFLIWGRGGAETSFTHTCIDALSDQQRQTQELITGTTAPARESCAQYEDRLVGYYCGNGASSVRVNTIRENVYGAEYLRDTTVRGC